MRLKLVPLLFLYACANMQNANFRPMQDFMNTPSGAEFQQQSPQRKNCRARDITNAWGEVVRTEVECTDY